MSFESLKLFIWREVRVGVVKADDHTKVNLVFVFVVEEGTSVGVPVERPAYSVLDSSRDEHLVWDFPDLFQADPVLLGHTV